MLYNYLRFIDGDDGVLTDLSIENQEVASEQTWDLVAGEDYIYLAQHFPFNNFFLKMGTVNSTIASNMTVEYWSGRSNQWKPMVDLLDGTKTGGFSLGRSGVVQYTPDPNFVWQRVRDTSAENFPDGIDSLKIYNVFWIRISFDVDMPAATSERLAYAFTRSQQLDDYDTDIDKYFEAFAAGKTDWDDEIMTASLDVVRDLKRQGLIKHHGRILRFDDVTAAADWRTLIIIYRNLGPGFADKLEEAKAEYQLSLNPRRKTLDKDEDAFTDSGEIANTVAVLTR